MEKDALIQRCNGWQTFLPQPYRHSPVARCHVLRVNLVAIIMTNPQTDFIALPPPFLLSNGKWCKALANEHRVMRIRSVRAPHQLQLGVQSQVTSVCMVPCLSAAIMATCAKMIEEACVVPQLLRRLDTQTL
jgi:hypothetical protein